MPGTNRLGALLALLAAVAALSGCGSDEISGEIPPEDAVALKAALAAVRTNVESTPPNCEEAVTQVEAFVGEVNLLPLDAGKELKTELRNAGENLRLLMDNECASTGTTETQPPPSSSTTTPTTTEPTTTEPTTTETTTEEQPPPGNGNGNGPPDDVPPGNGPPGDGTDGGTGGTGGGGTGDEGGD